MVETICVARVVVVVVVVAIAMMLEPHLVFLCGITVDLLLFALKERAERAALCAAAAKAAKSD